MHESLAHSTTCAEKKKFGAFLLRFSLSKNARCDNLVDLENAEKNSPTLAIGGAVIAANEPQKV